MKMASQRDFSLILSALYIAQISEVAQSWQMVQTLSSHVPRPLKRLEHFCSIHPPHILI